MRSDGTSGWYKHGYYFCSRCSKFHKIEASLASSASALASASATATTATLFGEDSLSPFNLGFIKGFNNSNKDAEHRHTYNSSPIPPPPTTSAAHHKAEFNNGYKLGYALGLCGSKQARHSVISQNSFMA